MFSFALCLSGHGADVLYAKYSSQKVNCFANIILEGNMNQREVTTGTSFLFSFPFWIFVNRDSSLSIQKFHFSGANIRIYPPFRSGQANFIPMPYIDPHAIPFRAGEEIEFAPDFRILSVTTIPGLDSEGRPTAFAVWESDWQCPPRAFPMDSLRLDVYAGSNAARVSMEVRNQLMSLLRWRSRQWWINRSVDALLGQLRNTFPVTPRGRPLDQPEGESQFRTFHGDEQIIDEHLWLQVINDIRNGIQVPAEEMLLLDAKFYMNSGDVRRAVLDAAGACEIAKDEAFERLWPKYGTGKQYRRGRVTQAKGYDLDRHISSGMKEYAGRSYADEQPTMFKAIEDLWNARGNIAHGHENVFYRNGKRYVVNQEVALKFAIAVEDCVHWLQAL